MGLRQWLDALVGRTRPVPARPDQLFALSTAAPTIRETVGWEPAGRAGLCLKPVATVDYADAQEELERLVGLGARETHSRLQAQKDRYGYTWLVLEDPDFEDLLTLTHMAARTLEEKGYGTQILSAVFRFRPGRALEALAGGSLPERLYLIYNYKRGKFYPFLPKGTGREPAEGRHHSGELQAVALLARDLPAETDPSRWYPIWDCPV